MFTIPGEPTAASQARELVLRAFGDLEFEEEGHKYTLNGKNLASVSSIGHRFIAHPFDEELQAERYAQRKGETAEFWLKKWRCNAFRASTLGTKTHEFGESLAYLRAGHPELIRPSVRSQYMPQYGYLAPLHPKEEAIEKFMDELPASYHLVLNEARVYSGKNTDASKNLREQICGTFDMLYYDSGEGKNNEAGFVVLDYKTNGSLQNEYSRRYHRKLLHPFEDLYEEDLGLYTIQLNLYALMLEDIGLYVKARRIVWLLPDSTYQIIDVPRIDDRLRKCI